ncbi:MAG: 4-(cytidine 5'-diphospho)-2-C-methyl-D-erythritol kinase [bacterium]
MTERPRAVQVAAQAKINLRLRVIAQESSGYHQVETLLLRLELADEIRVRLTSGERTLDVSGSDAGAIAPVEMNLAWRAAEAYFAASESRGGFAIELTKRIPIGGGLGGGSADAAAVLRALDAMADVPIGEPMLLGLAGRLGADVPFLATEHAYALAWGRGDRMVALTPPPARGAMLIVPPFGVNTAEAYGWLDGLRESMPGGLGVPSLALQLEALSDWERLAPLMENDFWSVVQERHPEIDDYLGALRSLGLRALMSGSGSTCVGVGDMDDANPNWRRDDRSRREGGRTILTRTATRVEPLQRIE